MSNHKPMFMVVRIDQPHRHWSVDFSREEAEKSIPSGEEYFKTKCKVVDEAEFNAAQKAFWVSDKPSVITKADWYEALEVLPPENWHTRNGVNMFFMSEYSSGTFTNMYAKYDDKYLTKCVDVTDKETWITKEDFNLD